MSRLFVMEDLRTLAARALAGGDYTPAESARVRAVPDTRTIRYYTTLGLLKPPAEMRGRTAWYNETHVLQIVAIKRLQADDLSLSDIQRRLVGLTNSRLAKIAKLPDGFWTAADSYLERRKKEPAAKRAAPKPTAPPTPAESATGGAVPAESLAVIDECAEFWLTPAALPSSVPATVPGDVGDDGDDKLPKGVVAVQPSLRAVIELWLSSGIELSIQFPSESKTDSNIDWAALTAAAQPLLKELRRQNIVRP